MNTRALIDQLFESTRIRFGWVRGDEVIEIPWVDGEDSHHVTHRDLLPSPDYGEGEWKRWRYNADLRTVVWWEAPSRQERDAVDELFPVDKHAYVELNSTPGNEAMKRVDRNRARKLGMKTGVLRDLAVSGNRITSRAGEDLLDVMHYPDARKDYVQRWLDTEGD